MRGKPAKIVSPTQERTILGYLEKECFTGVDGPPCMRGKDNENPCLHCLSGRAAPTRDQHL